MKLCNVLVVLLALSISLCFGQNSVWTEMRPTMSAGVEVMSTTMIAIPVAVGLRYEKTEHEMLYATCYIDDNIPVVVQTRGSYSPYYWAMSVGLSKRLMLTPTKSIGHPAKRFYVSPFIGTDFIPRWRMNLGLSIGIDFR